jgi:hypothetical protein
MGIIVDIKKDPRYQEGKVERNREIVQTMHRNEFESASIRQVTGLSEDVIAGYIRLAENK